MSSPPAVEAGAWRVSTSYLGMIVLTDWFDLAPDNGFVPFPQQAVAPPWDHEGG